MRPIVSSSGCSLAPAVPARWAALLLSLAGLVVATGLFPTPLAAQSAAPEQPATSVEEPAESLSSRQEALAIRYQRFETTLLQLAEYLRTSDPDRAELLVRALGKSKESRIHDQFGELVSLLEKGQLGDAIESQDLLANEMRLVLGLLQSEDRQSELAEEEQRILGLIRDVDGLIGKQTDARAATQRTSDPSKAGQQQQKVAQQTEQIVDKIQKQDAARGAESSPDSGKPTPDNPKGPTDQPDKAAPKDGAEPDKNSPGSKPSSEPDKPESDPTKPQKSQPGDESNPESSPSKPMPSKGQPSQGQPSQGQPSPDSPAESSPENSPAENSETEPSSIPPSSPESKRTPGREELERARQEMERAIEELKRQDKKGASDRQDRALNELLKAKEKLEEILRQIREEEQELLLAALEARFRDMLARQINVHNGTLGLAAIPVDQRSDRQRVRAIELARAQDEVALLAAKSLTLLKDEGSSVAFPQAVMQLRDDMLQSARRLERVDVDELTQAIQKDVIESLEEILDSLQKEMEKNKDKKQQQNQQQQQGQQEDPALVDALAELKMLRSLQYRVNRRTRQLGRLFEGEQAEDADLRQQLRELSARQARIQKTADDLAAGRNK